MDKEKQIEEITEIIRPFVSGLACEEESGVCEFVNCQYCRARDVARKIHKKVYRKQGEGEWRSELVKKCDWKGKKHDYYQPNSCSLCHEASLKRTPFCSHCGAKMKERDSQ